MPITKPRISERITIILVALISSSRVGQVTFSTPPARWSGSRQAWRPQRRRRAGRSMATCYPWLLRLLVEHVLVAPGAELLPLHPLRMLPPVLLGEVVPVAASVHSRMMRSRGMALPSICYESSSGSRVAGRVCSRLTTRDYFRILVTTPAPTVRPPSRIAKRSPSSIAIGVISSIVICMLSPGITISTPAGSSHAPVTSVVRK